jgi:hypothetical protein
VATPRKKDRCATGDVPGRDACGSPIRLPASNREDDSSVEEADVGGLGLLGGLAERGFGLRVERGLHDVSTVLAV